MPLSKNEIKNRIKPIERGSLEYRILDFLKRIENTDTPAYSLEEILSSFNETLRGTMGYDVMITGAYLSAINNLLKNNMIDEITIKNKPEKYYIAKSPG